MIDDETDDEIHPAWLILIFVLMLIGIVMKHRKAAADDDF